MIPKCGSGVERIGIGRRGNALSYFSTLIFVIMILLELWELRG